MNKVPEWLKFGFSVVTFLLVIAFGAGALIQSNTEVKNIEMFRIDSLESKIISVETTINTFQGEIKELNQILSDIKSEQAKITIAQEFIVEKFKE